MNKDFTYVVWACIDCTMLDANGEFPPEADEQRQQEILAGFESFGADTLTMGLLHGPEHRECFLDDSTTVDNPDCYGHTDYDEVTACETQEFSWRGCDICGSHLGGSRHAFTGWMDVD